MMMKVHVLQGVLLHFQLFHVLTINTPKNWGMHRERDDYAKCGGGGRIEVVMEMHH